MTEMGMKIEKLKGFQPQNYLVKSLKDKAKSHKVKEKDWALQLNSLYKDIVQSFLLHIREYQAMPRSSNFKLCCHGKAFEGIMEILQRKVELLDVVLAAHATRSFTGCLHRGQQQTDQNPDNSDHNQ